MSKTLSSLMVQARGQRQIHESGSSIWVCYGGDPCYAPDDVRCPCRGPVEPEPKIAKGES